VRVRDRNGRFCRAPRANNTQTDLTGERFGRLVVERFAGFVDIGTKNSSRRLWKCRCVSKFGGCGGITFQTTGALHTNNVHSCGCLNLEHRIKIGHANRKHGASVHVNGKQRVTREYVSWRSMRQRCEWNSPKNKCWVHYGARGIKVCKRWAKFENFLADMGPRPEGMTLHRLKNHLGYRPSNTVWATPYVQNHSRSISTSEILRKAWVTRRRNGRKRNGH
jgi:hypothetical protein